MADKTYRMTVALSNGNIVDAGNFVAPQGPQGPKGDRGPQGPQGPQGPKGDPGSGGGSPIISNYPCGLESGNITISISAGGLYYNKRASNGALTDGGAGVQTLTFDESEYNILMTAPIGTRIQVENEEGQLIDMNTTTSQLLIKKTPSLSDGAFYLTIISEYYS